MKKKKIFAKAISILLVAGICMQVWCLPSIADDTYAKSSSPSSPADTSSPTDTSSPNDSVNSYTQLPTDSGTPSDGSSQTMSPLTFTPAGKVHFISGTWNIRSDPPTSYTLTVK